MSWKGSRVPVELINVVLLDAYKIQEHEEGVQLWIRRLKDVLHVADDLFNEISTEKGTVFLLFLKSYPFLSTSGR